MVEDKNGKFKYGPLYRARASGVDKETGEELDNAAYVVIPKGWMRHGGRRNPSGKEKAAEIGYSDMWE